MRSVAVINHTPANNLAQFAVYSGQLSLLPSVGQEMSSSSPVIGYGVNAYSVAWPGAIVCLLAAPWVQLSVSVGNGWPHK